MQAGRLQSPESLYMLTYSFLFSMLFLSYTMRTRAVEHVTNNPFIEGHIPATPHRQMKEQNKVHTSCRPGD